MQKRAPEISLIDGEIGNWQYVGCGLKLKDEQGNENFEGFVMSQSDLGESILVMELEDTPDGISPKKVRTVFPIDNHNYEISLRQAELYSRIIAMARINVYLGKNICCEEDFPKPKVLFA